MPAHAALARTSAFTLGLFALTACVGLEKTAQDRAAFDLKCPPAQVSAYRVHDSVFVARGCGTWAQYSCFAPYRSDPVCVREAVPESERDTPPAPTASGKPPTAVDCDAFSVPASLPRRAQCPPKQ